METLKNASRAPNPSKDANLLSKFLLWYMNKTFSLGSSRPLEKGDVHDITDEDSSELLSEELERMWQKEKKCKENPSLLKCLWKMRGWTLLLCGFLVFAIESLRICQTVFLKQLIQSLSEPDFGKDNSAYIWATCLTSCFVIAWGLLHHTFLLIEKTGARLKSACVAMIYKKVLRLSNQSLAKITSGHIVTLISSDVHKVQEGFRFANYLWISPLQIIAAVVILWKEIGPSCLAGIGVFVITIPIQTWFGKFFAYMRSKTVAKTDQRVNIMNEVITSMQVIKMYAWEDSFAEMVNKVRRDESNRIMKTAIARSINASMFSVSPYLVSLATLALFHISGREISLAVVFLVLTMFFTIRWGVVLYFPLAIQMMTESYVSCRRIQAFLSEKEHSEAPATKAPYPDTPCLSKTPVEMEPSVHFKNVTAAWNDDSEDVICNLSFKADSQNSLVMIIGPVGSGKSSILMAAMNELLVKKGKIIKNGSIGYAAQQAWIFSGTLRSNILFGQVFDKKRYEKTITACALKQDIESFENKDLTLVGERGVSLSGGQRARISLARAVYSDADIYLLDDPLSAVDAKVGKHIFEKCIEGLLREKVVILATHQIQYLEHATNIVRLKEDANGVNLQHELPQKRVSKPQQKKLGGDLAKGAEEEMVYAHIDGQKDTLSLPTFGIGQINKGLQASFRSINSFRMDDEIIEEEEEEESRKRGTVSANLYMKYIIQGVGYIASLVLLLSLAAGQVMLTLTDFFLANWASGEEQSNANVTITARYYVKSNPEINIYIFASLVAASFLMNLFRTIYFYATFVKCSRKLHNSMFKAVLKAPIHFFNTNPVGQILNRFSRDVYFMDDELPWTFFDFSFFSLLTLAVIILNCISVPYLTILLLPLLIIFFFSRRYYLKSSRELRRLEAVSRSPLYTHVSATLAGITTIRSFNIQDKILREFYACQDYQTGAWIMFLLAARWFSQRLDLLTVLFSICSTFAPIVAATYIVYYVNKMLPVFFSLVDIDTNLVAVSLSYILVLCGMFQWTVRQSVEVDNMMTSVERVFEYTKLEPEPDNGNSKKLRKTWPEQGSISGTGASFTYHSSLPHALRKLHFDIRPMEKIGIVGRTGAGKSSLFSMLFRMGNVSGTVKIDGYPIADLKLKDLRRNISIIPQDPVMFSGSLRKNLDPFNEYTDADVWEAIEEVQLKENVAELPGKLESEITEAGSNLSVGERQLLCLARALLKKNKIIVIDEATANVDVETDSLIQQTIREKFKECTVLTVAHRLNTVIDSDRVMVLEDGNIMEFDEPYDLLQNKSGYFRKLVDQVGLAKANKLEILAEESKNLRNLRKSNVTNIVIPTVTVETF
ncbi:ATP-binding cassette sub-family C member 4-like [Hydractinia symbiolongicarpus]|uniref:ATP-binding cassette sub-family C member 4-like n=1 Tax=Hydractinia symbiolongicarpus TaxID=13093 RepID=UPI002550C9E3|nr:ATP-binding cassette sub-family C member 4-like [Hydractinia symbiolongicarpus]